MTCYKKKNTKAKIYTKKREKKTCERRAIVQPRPVAVATSDTVEIFAYNSQTKRCFSLAEKHVYMCVCVYFIVVLCMCIWQVKLDMTIIKRGGVDSLSRELDKDRYSNKAREREKYPNQRVEACSLFGAAPYWPGKYFHFVSLPPPCRHQCKKKKKTSPLIKHRSGDKVYTCLSHLLLSLGIQQRDIFPLSLLSLGPSATFL